MNSIDGKCLLCTDEYSLAFDWSSFILECEQDAPVTPQTTTNSTTIDDENYDDAEDDDEQSTTYMEQHYQNLSNCMFKDRPIIRRRGDYDLEDLFDRS